ncbi:transcriptional regulator [Polymorphobacter glacialis]|uniref:Transcriptional regulator n=1 Tax=Sandarakinorhabdus glacialis TaxID=1614636 RepID=A0A916ZHV1_9SPHN|nr:FMN-binding negative transcriptional regulator [Polymorphobacter glacialis]GGD99065.1 transcriptional regulator [Polymorphobacter glacialis]
MHPNGAFRFRADDPALAFVAAHGFAHLFGMTPDGPRVAHVPLLVTEAGTVRFHLAKSNALAAHLDGEPVLASIGGPGSYISPNWYADPAANVPTWNYRTVEIEGVVKALDWDALGELLDLTAATFEPRVGEDWTMDKMAPARAEAMMKAITAYELVPDIVRTTDKASQNRNEDDARLVVAALERIGDTGGAAAIRRTRGW